MNKNKWLTFRHLSLSSKMYCSKWYNITLNRNYVNIIYWLPYKFILYMYRLQSATISNKIKLHILSPINLYLNHLWFELRDSLIHFKYQNSWIKLLSGPKSNQATIKTDPTPNFSDNIITLGTLSRHFLEIVYFLVGSKVRVIVFIF